MNHSWRISRRTVLRGLGTAIALPMLDAMAPALSRAAQEGLPVGTKPLRAAFIYVPNGKHMADWTPATTGADFELPYILEPLQGVRNKLLVLSGLAQDHGRPHGDGPGDHARALASFLTGAQARKTHGADIKAGVSVDQVAARALGQKTRFASIELGCDQGAQAGNCDSGYSCAYSTNISWRNDTTPQAKEIDPKLAFERLFSTGGSPRARSQRERYQQSILDYVREDARSLQSRLGIKDRRKVDEYLTAVRDLEKRIGLAAQAPPTPLPDYPPPSGIPSDYGEHIRLMYDLMALAFAADLTRVATFVAANEGSNRSYPFIGVPDGHHDLSHHRGDQEKQEKLRAINHFHVTHLAYFLEKLNGLAEGNESVLDNSMILYGSGIGDGNAHNHDNLPILLAGQGGGTIVSGRHVRCEKETPLNNLFLSMLDRLGTPVESLGDSTDRLESLS
ncbi:MAG TPA: DUF1552 domain-containing protein [Pirellulales bacterium]|jgi:hypothetical protein|nr:DUF1552 domain-containing protein [Pirellulales bacterium]